MRMMVSGGGTGGHTSPAVAIIEEMQKRDPQLVLQWVGCRDSIEQRVCETAAIPFRSVPVIGWPRQSLPRKLWAAVRLFVSMARSFFFIQKFRPQVVLGVGGYVSVPLLWVAQLCRVPTVLHEQNKQLGMANRLLARRARRLLLSFPDTLGEYDRSRASLVGNPVRQGFIEPPTREEACAALGLDPSIPVVLVSGGSQGARRLNDAMSGAVKEFAPGEVQFIWMTGVTDAPDARAVAYELPLRVDVHAFIDDMATACAASTLIVSRGGASSTAEIAVLGKPSILVPYPHATDNHQERNARAFADAGAAVLILDEDCDSARLTHEIRTLLGAPDKLKDMEQKALAQVRPAAVETIAEEILSIVFKPRNH